MSKNKISTEELYLKNSSLRVFNSEYIQDMIKGEGYKSLLVQDASRIPNNKIRYTVLRRILNMNEEKAKKMVLKILKSPKKTYREIEYDIRFEELFG